MRNIFTIQVESSLGAIFISILALFFIGLMFIAMKNFDSDLTILTSEELQIRTHK